MNFTNLFRIALKALSNNKMRGFLTMLGIIIGVAAVITMLAIGQGSKVSIRSEIGEMGSNMIMVMPGGDMMGGVRSSSSDMQSLKLKDYEDIRNNCDLLSYVSPLVQSSGQAIFGASNTPTSMYGVNADYLEIRRYKVQDGDFFTDQDIRTAAKVCVVGKSVVDALFVNGENPVGQVIRYGSIPMRIVGVLESKGYNTMGMDQDDLIIAPYTTVQKRILAITHLQQIVCSAVDEGRTQEAISQIEEVLVANHKIKDGDEEDFNIRSQEEISSMMDSVTSMLTLLLAAVAGISLIVGGIGIMNIMYVSVTERTREIGLRMSIGAKGRDILAQFLVESSVISLVGGVLGIIFGLLLSFGIARLAAMTGTTLDVTVNPVIVLGATLFSIAVGLFFGVYPANQAANLDPVIALRSE